MKSLKELVAGVFNIDKSEINDDSSPESISTWDSFNGLMLISELEKNFEVKFTIEEVMSVTKFRDIKEVLKKHGVRKGLDE